MIRWVFALLVGLAALAVPVLGQDSMPPAPYAYNQLDDPRLEAEASALMHTLRCLKCQSQSIADSDAPMAGDMRHQVRSRILAGESPDQIRAWLIARYGDYVSYEPEVSATTWPLFAVPVLLLLIVGGVLLRRLGRKRNDAGEAA
ncbi:cytochrome c-type biogenesis protein [Erythrobacter sp. BLCC-B19]|uniref:cytochrome c-type biogenesis protein n=1 Tax=Erythrobacter sp. BLCC-B19 TaxID=3025315 RepID=UPI0023613A66|nr:cytochrome c-type biogenesis protein [Erythrobacter sp. BLCC-B19]WDA41034.1 cytochrome c-type biogenesis protein CcmH [Erythrobacter sp. BLCC-B19]